jgi:hypothetical protein
MDMRILAVTAFLLILGSGVTGMELEVSIAENLGGHAAWFNLSNGPAQTFGVRWENTGSVNCLSRPRIDIYTMDNDSLGNVIYTAWGSEESIMAGGSRAWQLYSSLSEGDYAAVLRMYYCNEMFEEEPYRFSAPGREPAEDLSIENIVVHPDYIDVAVRGTGNMVVIPQDYPRGWIFQGGLVDENMIARLGFVPVGPEGTSATLMAVSSEGKYVTREFSLVVPEEEVSVPWEVAIVMLALIVFLLYVSRNIIKIWRR